MSYVISYYRNKQLYRIILSHISNYILSGIIYCYIYISYMVYIYRIIYYLIDNRIKTYYLML